MRKIPTLFVRDPDDMRHVLPEVHPDCGWVLAGEGVATRKYDGTCVALLGGVWWARREVKPGKAEPAGFQPLQRDETTGKTVGWEPIERSSFARWHAEALDNPAPRMPHHEGTYELCGPKVQGNPEGFDRHALVAHADAERMPDFDRPPSTALSAHVGLGLLLRNGFGHEGIVWHHPDGRMAKLKGRDFPGEDGGMTALDATALDALPDGTVIRGVATVLGDSRVMAVVKQTGDETFNRLDIRAGTHWLVTGSPGPMITRSVADMLTRWHSVEVIVPGLPVLGLTVGSAFAAAVADVRRFEQSGCWQDSWTFEPGPDGFSEIWPGFAGLLALTDGAEVPS